MDQNIKRRTFNNTAAALIEYDAGAAAREGAWNRVEQNVDADAAQQADLLALRKVQEAFHKDTSDINSLDNCYRVDIDFMRRVAHVDLTPA
ncbi:hypothetical protein [Massilia sp. TN1-12]|uniref:hypothetical protein n=1 Tax=Massilia paldalensis TaxID=3377675 RepID=UPI00384EE0BC